MPHRKQKSPPSAPRGPVPRSRSGVIGRRWERTGTEPVTARSALRVRYILSLIFVPLFVAGAVVFWYWMSQSGPSDAPSEGSLRLLALVCSALALFALADLAVVLRRRRREGITGQPLDADPASP
ncbi:DUF6343 family protein [Streptomyces sp. N2-109]|uniref:DUF6343 family protein n=1 Tax=Streptomyces gossypii TaxID=2883101 RepID=A0ABT2JV16_9ACTN|nr:DUF6343 family protein [Streptomyces gossypii]MCT2591676.1 DUF6343 family protein [Streptomyces gossypii]